MTAMDIATSALPTTETDLKLLLAKYTVEDPLETAFQGCIREVLLPNGRSKSDFTSTLKAFFSAAKQENLLELVQQYVHFVSVQTNHERVRVLLAGLKSLVSQQCLPSRLACEVLLSYLDISNILVWVQTLDLVHSLVGGVHYKGVRDLMKLLFNKFDCLPRNIPDHQLQPLKKGQELLQYILNRNSILLPAYFAHDEICRHYPDKNLSAHWILQEVISGLQDKMREAADLVSGIVQPHLRPVLGLSNVALSIWRLDPAKHCCALRGLLPYRESLLSPQEELLFHVVSQQNSKDAVHSVLGLTRGQLQPSPLVEASLVRLGVVAMEMQERSMFSQQFQMFEVWSHFASQLVFFHYLHLIDITTLLAKLKEKLCRSRLRKGRDWLMWSLLYFSSTIQSSKGSQPATVFQKEFIPILNLFSLLYQDREPLPVPDISKPIAVYRTAAASVWMFYSNKGKADNVDLPRSIPHVLNQQIEWLMKQTEEPSNSPLYSNYSIPILLNIYSNHNEVAGKLLKVMLDSMVPSHSPSPEPGSTHSGSSPVKTTPQPISLETLNSLAMHAKIRLMEMIKMHLIKVVEAKNLDRQVTPALLETYSRLLVRLGTRNFQSHLIPAVFKSQAWGVLHSLLEIIVFRVHLQLQYSYRFQLLQQLHTVASVSIIPTQLYGSTENAALRLIKGLGSHEFLIQLAKQFATDPKPLLSMDSEELNRIFVLVVAQSLHISNIDTTNWLEPFMRTVLTTAPNQWCESTLAFFPAAFRQACSTPSPSTQLLTKVEDETKRFQMSSEIEQIRLFTETESTSLFLCVLWKLVMETSSVSPVLIKIAQRTQPKKMAAFMRQFVDYVILSLPPATPNMSHLENAVKWLNELMWKYNLFPVDRLVMCMVLRGSDSEQSVQSLCLVHALLTQNDELVTRVNALVELVPADYWTRPEWCSKHAAYLQRFPEKFQPEEPGTSPPVKGTSMPMYFGNICLRFLPVLDLLIHRLLEVPSLAALYLHELLARYGPLYKFHDQPLCFLYTTLHYYQMSLVQNTAWKKLLVASVIGAQKDLHPMKWFFTEESSKYLQADTEWLPSDGYFSAIIMRLVQGLQPFSSLPTCDWHFSEFSSSLTFFLYTSCVELMSLPLTGQDISLRLIQALYDKASEANLSEEHVVLSWINALGIMLVALPETFHAVLYKEVLDLLERAEAEPVPPSTSWHTVVGGASQVGCLLSLLHSFWLHANMGLLLHLPRWLAGTVRPCVKTEWQLLFLCHLIGPILNRLTSEKPKLLLEVVMEIYSLVVAVDREQRGSFLCSDLLCDFLYHIKYMHIGDNDGIEELIMSLNTPLKLRLQFLCRSLHDKHPPSSVSTSSATTPANTALSLAPPTSTPTSHS